MKPYIFQTSFWSYKCSGHVQKICRNSFILYYKCSWVGWWYSKVL